MVRQKYEAGGYRQAWGQTGDGRGCAQVPNFTVIIRRQLRRRQLRHVRPRLRIRACVSVAQCAHFGDGGEQAAGC